MLAASSASTWLTPIEPLKQFNEALALLARLSAELNEMADGHIRRSQADYLRYGMEASGGTVEAAMNGRAAIA